MVNGTGEWDPEWRTIEAFAKIQPINLFHKEQVEPAIEKEEGFRQNLHVLIRGEFCIRPHGKKEKSEIIPGVSKESGYCLKISADDHYKLYLDGNFIQEGPAPAYHSHYYYNEIRLEGIEPGEHVLGIHLYYQGLVNRVYNSGDLRCAFAAELTDETGMQIPIKFVYQETKAYDGKTAGYETQFLENFDSRKFDKTWNLPKENAERKIVFEKELKSHDTGKWKTPVFAEWADYVLFPQPVKMLTHTIRNPFLIQEFWDGTIFIDAGEEITGNVLLYAEGKAGDTVEVLCGEECERKSRVRFDMRCNCSYREIWTLGDGECRLEPYDYKGFRYARLLPSAGVRIKEIRLLVRHYPMDETLCSVTSSEKKTERIFQICKNAVRLGTQEGYLDCPTREKGQYLGDAVVTAHAQVWLTGETEMLLKCIDQFAQSARVCPGLLAVAPGGLMQEIADFSLLYSQLILLYYRFTGDAAVVESYYDTAAGILEHFFRYEREDGLLEQVSDKWNLVDWPENLRDGYDFPLTRPVVAQGCHNVVNALLIGAKTAQNEMAEILKRPAPYKLTPLKEAYGKAFYRKESGLFADSETSNHTALHSNVYAMYFGLVQENRQERILDFIEKKGFSCGVMHSYFVLRTLAKAGRHKAVYRLMMNEGEHGWYNMLREGATACFEAWGKDQKWNTSLCHPWASAPIPVLLEEIAGIHPNPETARGYDFHPQIPECVENFCARMPFRGKLITVTKSNGKIYMEECWIDRKEKR